MTPATRISLQLAVQDAPSAADWYQRVLGAQQLWRSMHRQGGFTDPFGHVWLVGDKSPLQRFRA
jgi:PhnB protein